VLHVRIGSKGKRAVQDVLERSSHSASTRLMSRMGKPRRDPTSFRVGQAFLPWLRHYSDRTSIHLIFTVNDVNIARELHIYKGRN
jgi:hypothetical protein